MEAIYEQLKDLQVGDVKLNERMENHTTLKVGGPASLFVEPSSINNLKTVIDIVKKYDLNWKVIGRGSNLLVSEEGYDGVFIKIDRAISELEINGGELTVGAGHSLISLAIKAQRESLTGLEFAAGIPGSVGGAVYMNAGAHGSDISKVLKKAHILYDDGTFAWLTNEEMDFSYRTSTIQKNKNAIIVEAVFQLEEGDKQSISEKMSHNKMYRKETQPWDAPCAGSIFRNPLPNYAGKLIEDAGLKGYSHGGAKVSPLHGNFIVNDGNATATDILQLIDFIKNEILEKYGITLQTEVEIIVQK